MFIARLDAIITALIESYSFHDISSLSTILACPVPVADLKRGWQINAVALAHSSIRKGKLRQAPFCSRPIGYLPDRIWRKPSSLLVPWPSQGNLRLASLAARRPSFSSMSKRFPSLGRPGCWLPFYRHEALEKLWQDFDLTEVVEHDQRGAVGDHNHWRTDSRTSLNAVRSISRSANVKPWSVRW